MSGPSPKSLEEARELVNKSRKELILITTGETTFNKFWEPIIALALDRAKAEQREEFKKSMALWRATAGALHDVILDAEKTYFRSTAKEEK